MLYLPAIDSSLISSIEYDEINQNLTFHFKKYYVDQLTYSNIPLNVFDEMCATKSIGKFYLHFIKQNFTIMAQAPKGINKSSKDKRFITMRINVKAIQKDWIYSGEKGDYLDIVLMLLPDGEVDDYGALGMVVQKVPKDVYTKDKKVKGNILGNGYEYDWNDRDEESNPNTELKKASEVKEDFLDDLPF